MQFEVDCPNCGQTVEGKDIERKKGETLVARRQTAFDGAITSLTEMGNSAYLAVLPCGCEVLTVN